MISTVKEHGGNVMTECDNQGDKSSGLWTTIRYLTLVSGNSCTTAA